MKNYFFTYLNYILKVDKKKPEIPNNPSYMTNRWLSMASKPIAQIVNATMNRWNVSDSQFITDFYHSVIPRYTKRIEYIKKAPKQEEEFDENLDHLCFSMQISRKELDAYNETLEVLNLTSK